MKPSLYLLIAVLLGSLCPGFAQAASSYGGRYSYLLVAKDPDSMKGYQFSAWYDPGTLVWRKFHLFFEADYSHWWVTSTPYYRTTSIFTVAPVVRYIFNQHYSMSPYFEFSIGPSYLNHLRLDNQKLGEHFIFQDRVGVGVIIGPAQRFTVGVHALHYSNAGMSSNNSGITVPLMLDLGYRFK